MFRWNFGSRSRHPLARLLTALIAVVALLVLIVFGVFAAAALVVGGAILVLVKALRASYGPGPAAAGRATDQVIEGEFRVTREPQSRHQPAP